MLASVSPSIVNDFVMVNGCWSTGRSYRPPLRMQLPPSGATDAHFCNVANAVALLLPSALSDPLRLTKKASGPGGVGEGGDGEGGEGGGDGGDGGGCGGDGGGGEGGGGGGWGGPLGHKFEALLSVQSLKSFWCSVAHAIHNVLQCTQRRHRYSFAFPR